DRRLVRAGSVGGGGLRARRPPGAGGGRRRGLRPRQRGDGARRGAARPAARRELHRGARRRGDPDPLGRQPARGGAAPRAAPPADGRASFARRRTGRGADRGRGVHAGAVRRGPGCPRPRACLDGDRRRLARRGEGRRLGRPRRRLGRGFREPRGARRAARRGGRVLARRHERGLAAALGPGRPDRHEGLARPLHRLRDQRCDAAHRRLQGREADPRRERGRRGADPVERGLRGDRRPARDRARDLRRAAKGARLVDVVAGALGLTALASVAGAVFARRALFLWQLVRRGQPSDRSGDLGRRVRAEAVVVLGQRKLLQRLVPGLMHAFVFWGFLVLFPTILLAAVSAVDRNQTIPWLGRQGWFMTLADVFVILVLAGVATAFVIRKVVRPRRFEGSHLGEADLILAWIAAVVLTLLCWHAARIEAGLAEWPRHWSFLSDALAPAFP